MMLVFLKKRRDKPEKILEKKKPHTANTLYKESAPYMKFIVCAKIMDLKFKSQIGTWYQVHCT